MLAFGIRRRGGSEGREFAFHPSLKVIGPINMLENYIGATVNTKTLMMK